MAINFVKMFDPEQAQDPRQDYKQKMALAQSLLTGDTGAIYSPAAGIAKVAEKAAGGWMARMIQDEENKANSEAGNSIAQALMNWGGAGSSTNAGAATPAAPTEAPFKTSIGPSVPDPTGPSSDYFRSQNAMGGIDPKDMDTAVRTVLAEAGNQGPEGMQAVAAVLANRARLAGTTIGQEALKPNQFEPWNPGSGNDPRRFDPASPEYQTAYKTILPVLTGQGADPTGGATHFYAPKAQAALGRSAPSWDNGTGVDLGAHRFFKLPYGNSGQQGPVQVASTDPSIGVSGGAPTPAPSAQPAPVQVAQAGPQANPLASALQAPSIPTPTMTPQQQETVRQLLGNPRTRAAGMALIQQQQERAQAAQKMQQDLAIKQWEMGVQKANKDSELSNIDNGTETLLRDGRGNIVKTIPKKLTPMTAAPNTRIVDPNNGAEIYKAPAAPTGDMTEYDLYVKQQLDAGKPVDDFTTWAQGMKKAGAASVTVDQRAENAENAERGKGLATRLNKIADDGDTAAMELTTIKRMNELGNNVDPGSRTAFLEDLRKNFGIQLDPNADAVQGFKAMIGYMKPRMRVAGSGTSSDRDMDSFEQSIMNLRATPGGNEIIANTLGGMAQLRMMRGEIAQRYQVGEISAKQAMDEMKALPDPFDQFKQWQKQNPNAPKGAPGATVDNPDNGLKAAPAPKGYPADAKQAPDGNWYVPDPNRPGKYLRVQ